MFSNGKPFKPAHQPVSRKMTLLNKLIITKTITKIGKVKSMQWRCNPNYKITIDNLQQQLPVLNTSDQTEAAK